MAAQGEQQDAVQVDEAGEQTADAEVKVQTNGDAPDAEGEGLDYVMEEKAIEGVCSALVLVSALPQPILDLLTPSSPF